MQRLLHSDAQGGSDMAKYWIAHSKVNTWKTNVNPTEVFVNHKIWYTNAPSAEKQVKEIVEGDNIAYIDDGKIIALGVVNRILDLNAPHDRLFFLDVKRLKNPKPSPINVRRTLIKAKDEHVKAIWGNEV
jgi:C-terminal processing protease CtpA/Prc